MIAVDTNIVVRLLTGDDPKQLRAAQPLLAGEQIWIAKTVLLETGWVLRSLYGYDEIAVHNALSKLLGLANVQAEDESSVAAALSLADRGISVADAMHLSSRPPGATFASFDKPLVNRATRAGVPRISNI
jgi:predicted nucleic-acid-binding protein